MPNEENDNSPGMLFDSVFKTATQKAGHLMVAVIEQMFHVKTEYDRIYTELSRIILNYVTRKLDSDLNERLVTLLGGQIIELRQDIWFKEGAKQRDRDKITDMLRRGKTPEEIADFCAYPMDLIKEVQEEMLPKVK